MAESQVCHDVRRAPGARWSPGRRVLGDAKLELSGSTAGFGGVRGRCTSRWVRRFCRAAQGEIIMAQSALFQPIRVGNLDLCNRIVIAPMCQYSAEDGCMTDWHLIHLGHLALSGAALLTIEATSVLPEGRITWADVGLWNDETEAAIGRTLESIRRWSTMPIAIQLAHAGRKASSEVPWKGGRQLAPDDPHGWQTVSA